MNEIVADEMAILPGMEELANLLYIVNYYESGDYDAVLVDCAPTGDTLRLLGFPEVLRWWMGRMFPIGRTAATMLRPFVKPMLGMPLPNAEVFDSIEDLYQELLRMHSLLTDPEKSSVRLVLNPEKMVINEAQRTFAYLNLYGYPVDGIICNRLLPDELEHSFFNSWKESQNKYYQLVEQSFSPIPILKAPLLEQEVVGEERLRTLAQTLYQEQDPLKFFFKGKTQQIEKEDTYYVLSLILPFTTKEQVSLMRHSDELIVQVGSFRRQLFLPHFLAELSVKEAKFEDEKLKIKFAE
jgi:arsenite-transporting ATPase